MSDHIANQIRAIADWLDGENPFVLGSGATIPFPEASEKVAELRRIAQTLEAGVVVPVDVAKRLGMYTAAWVTARYEAANNPQHTDDFREGQREVAEQAKRDFYTLQDALSRLQQNWGEGR